MRVNEDSFSIQIRDDAGTFAFVLEKRDREESTSSGASRRCRLTKGSCRMTELTDLVAYLASLKEAK